MKVFTSLDQSGQSITELMLIALFILIPFLGGALKWFNLEWDKSKCASETYTQARAQLIQTQLHVQLTFHCGTLSETVNLASLEELDQKKTGLDLNDATSMASQLLGGALSSVHLPSQ